MGNNNRHRYMYMIVFLALSTIMITACGETHLADPGSAQFSPFTRQAPQVGRYKVGKPYRVAGRWYRPREYEEFSERGIASWYGRKFHGRRTANGEIFDMNYPSAAHKTLPLPSMILVSNLENGRQVKLRVNDRGPFAHDRILDVSRRAADLLGFRAKGTTRVHIKLLAEESHRLKQVAVNGGGSSSTIPTGGIVQTSSRGVLTNVWQDVSSAIEKAEPIYPAWNEGGGSLVVPAGRGLTPDRGYSQVTAYNDPAIHRKTALSKAQDDVALLPPARSSSESSPSIIAESELLPHHQHSAPRARAWLGGEQKTNPVSGPPVSGPPVSGPIEYLRPRKVDMTPAIDQSLSHEKAKMSEPALSTSPENEASDTDWLDDRQKRVWSEPEWAWGLRGDKPSQRGL